MPPRERQGSWVRNLLYPMEQDVALLFALTATLWLWFSIHYHFSPPPSPTFFEAGVGPPSSVAPSEAAAQFRFISA